MSSVRHNMPRCQCPVWWGQVAELSNVRSYVIYTYCTYAVAMEPKVLYTSARITEWNQVPCLLLDSLRASEEYVTLPKQIIIFIVIIIALILFLDQRKLSEAANTLGFRAPLNALPEPLLCALGHARKRLIILDYKHTWIT